MTEETQETSTASPVEDFVAALLSAQRSIDGLIKDGNNAFHKYKYVSGEMMIRECRAVLIKHGLLLQTKETAILQTMPAPDGDAIVAKLRNKESMQTVLSARQPQKLKKSYSLTHVAGHCETYEQEWTVYVENGRGPDKAVAAALTASLSYFLRDLLLIPRVNTEDELDADHADRNQEPKPEPPSPEKKRLVTAVGKEMKRLKLAADDVKQWCDEYGAENPKQMNVDDLKKLLEALMAVE